MPIELLLILLLLVVFIIAPIFELNIGLVALVAAYVIGVGLLGMKTSAITGGFPGDLFIILLGLILLMSIANLNGSVDYLVGKMIQLSGGNIALLPWLVFFTGVIVSSFGPPAAPILFIIGLNFAKKYSINPLLMGALALHGTQAGMYSPVAPYGALLAGLAKKSGIEIDSLTLYGLVVALNFLLAIVLFFAFGGKKLIGQQLDKLALKEMVKKAGSLNLERGLTFLGFLIFLVASMIRPREGGFVALTISMLLLMIATKKVRRQAIENIAWPILLIISGVLILVNVLESAGTFVWLAEQGNALGSPKLVGLILGYIAGAVTTVTSTFGTFGILVPMAAPFVESGALNGTTLLVAISVAASVTDISPFSTFGAMFLSFAEEFDKQKLMKQMFRYTIILILVMPLVTWLLLVLPNW